MGPQPPASAVLARAHATDHLMLHLFLNTSLAQVVDEKLLQFKKEQRDNRNKAKLEYIIGAALEGPQVLLKRLTG